MPISPYSTPIQYEYKPLNLSAFAAPLSAMQEKFDIATEAIDAADFTLANLPYGTDPERAKELIKTVKSKRDELAKNLAETKNYKQAASKLRELNTLWQKDPELNALQANAKLWAERDKAERERIDKPGGITRDQYLQWKDREIRKYKENKGAAFTATAADKQGTYNQITGQTGRLADLSKDLEELSWKVASAVPENKMDAFRSAGIDPTTLDAKFVKTVVEEKDAKKIAQLTSDYLRTLPRFRDWATEVADYNHDQLQQNPEAYKQVASELNDKYLSSLNYQISAIEKAAKKDKNLLKGAEYTDLMEEKAKAEQAKLTGEYDATATKNLYTHQHLNNVYDMGALGKVLAYKNVTHDYTFRDMPSEGDGSGGGGNDGATGNGIWAPDTEHPWSIPTLGKTKIDAGKNLYKVGESVNKLAAGNVGLAVMGKKDSKLYKNLIKNPDQIRARQEQLFTTLTQTISRGGDWKTFRNLANKQGIELTDNLARTIWGSMTKVDKEGNNTTITEYANYLNNSQKAFNDYVNSDKLLGEIKNKAVETDEYKTVAAELGNYIPPEAIVYGMGVDEEGNEDVGDPILKRLFNPASYTKQQLAKAGYQGGNVLSLGVIAKLRGYDNVQDAIDKGYNFGNVPIINPIDLETGKPANSAFPGKGNFAGGTIEGILNKKIKQVYEQSLTKTEQSYRYIKDEKVDDVMSKHFLAVSDLSQYLPAYSSNWNNQPGFTKDGKLAPGTVLNITKDKAPKLVKHGNSIFFDVPVKIDTDEDGKPDSETVLRITPKPGSDVEINDILYKIDAASAGGNTELSKQTNDMVKEARFDSAFKTTLSPQLVKSVGVTPLEDGGKRVELTSIPYGANAKIAVVKVQAKAENNPVLKIAVMDNYGNFLQYMDNTETGKDWYYNADSDEAAGAAKVYIMKMINQER
jgi:hypothetical protein